MENIIFHPLKNFSLISLKKFSHVRYLFMNQFSYYGKMLCIFPNISGKAFSFSEKSALTLFPQSIYLIKTIIN